MEKVILYLTDAGFGTCWLEGTFNQADFAGKINIADNKIIPAYTFWLWRCKKSAGGQNDTGYGRIKSQESIGRAVFNGDFAAPLSIEEASVYAKY